MADYVIPAEFFLDYPLFRKLRMDLPLCASDVELPSMVARCRNCGNEQTFNPVGHKDRFYVNRSEDKEGYQPEDKGYVNVPVTGKEMVFIFRCAGCRKSDLVYYIKFADDSATVHKIGQSPPWTIGLEKALERRLGQHGDLFRKGLVCESQGYGIGAYAYYRRVIEDMIDGLLVDILNLLDPATAEKKTKELSEIRGSKRTIDKIDVVSKLLPQHLMPEGTNPLKLLHDRLSEHIHARSDEDCLEMAVVIREVLVYLVTKLKEAKEQDSKFLSSVRKLLKKTD